jgi:hypothetical protein
VAQNASMRSSAKATYPDQEEVKTLLAPVVALLKAAGLDIRDAQGALAAVWADAQQGSQRSPVERLDHAAACAAIVSTWIRDRDFADEAGNPRVLAMPGRRGFGALVKLAAPEVKPLVALATLRKYGNVSKNRQGLIRLRRSFLQVCTDARVAYEPSATFLADAADTVRATIGAKSSSKGPLRTFWRVAESDRLPSRKVSSYLSYVNRRSLAFLLELDDWLEANSLESSNRLQRSSKRVGLGLFTICSPIKPTPKS